MGLFLSPVGLVLAIVIVIVILLFRHRLVSFLAQPVPNYSHAERMNQAQQYWPRSQHRMKLVGSEMDLIAKLASKNILNERVLAESCARIRTLAEEQRNEIVPDPALEGHRQGYFQIMDIQVRKMEDLIATGGANLDTLVAEENTLLIQANTPQYEAMELTKNYGLPKPDFDKRKTNWYV